MRKTLLTLFALCLFVLCGGNSYAATYGPDFAKFTVTAEPGWTEKAVDSGVQLTNNKSVLIIQFVKSGGLSPEDFAKSVVKQIPLPDAQYDYDKEKGVCSVSAKKDSIPYLIIVVQDDSTPEDFGVFTMIGDEIDVMKKMISSAHDAK